VTASQVSETLSAFCRRSATTVILGLITGLWLATASAAGQETAPIQALARMRVLLGEAEALQRQRRTNEALIAATEAIRLAPKSVEGWMLRGRLRAANGAFRDAAADFAKVLELNPRDPDARFQRALARFRDGRLARAVEDFDRLAEMAPQRMPELWQRGVALSLAGRHDDARRQFEAHRRVNTNDVELSAWHYFSVAKLEGPAQARSALLPVSGDPRVPMPEIWRLYAGQAEANAVFAAAESVSDEATGAAARFYARLYVAMYLDAHGRPTEALPLAREAAAHSAAYDFLGQAARLYAEQLAARVATGPADREPTRAAE
jgi:tetratricopeptide (TPR) repeat protein